MNGRYGTDELNSFIFKIYVLLLILNIFIKSNIIFYIELFLLLIILLRYFSKNIYRRGRENRAFLNIKNKLIFKDDKIYRRCHKCKIKLKLPLPSKIGIKKVKCPECGHRNKFIILRREKIDIIRNR
jgi:hypothetical protein